ncbi:MAG TPA: glycosyltransferase, partial [Feifaniaceae bacterium]|nr:glycosyltransferase [Feifaniaceae bacterium]
MKTRAPASRIKLTISLLVSNRIGTIRKCLDSVKPLLDQLPSELIVVDTVGEENSDGSLAVAREYTDRIVRFHWCNDFAAARNAGLERARGEWFLYLDDDEWFEDVTPILAFLKNDDGSYRSCVYDIRNYDDRAGSAYMDAMACRMVRRSADTVFKNKIHEYLEHFTPVKQLNCFVHHYGYVYESSAERIAHSRRNIAPLLEMLEDDPRDIRNILHLCQEYYAIREYRKVRELCERALEFGLKTTTAYMGQIAVYYIHVLHKSNEIQAMLDAARTFVEHPHVTELTKAMICLILQSVDSPLITEEAFLWYADAYFSNVDMLDRDPDRLIGQLIMSMKESISDHHRKYMLQRVMQLCKALGLWDKARGYIQRYCLNGGKADAFLSACMAPAVDAALASGELRSLSEELYPSLQKPRVLSDFLRISETALAKMEDAAKWDGIRTLSRLPLRHPRITAQKLLLAERENRAEDLPALVEEYAAMEIGSIPADDLLSLCCRNNVSPQPLAGKLFIETWEATAILLLKRVPPSEREAFLGFLQRYWRPDSPEMLFLKANIFFDALTDLVKGTPEPADFDAAFSRYVETNAAYYRLLSP